MASVTRQMFTRCFVADDHNHSQSISENVNDSLHSGCIKFTDCNFTVLTPPVSSYHVSLELFRLLSRHLKKCDSFWCKYSPIIQGKDRQEAMGSGKRHVHSSCRRAEKAAPPPHTNACWEDNAQLQWKNIDQRPISDTWKDSDESWAVPKGQLVTWHGAHRGSKGSILGADGRNCMGSLMPLSAAHTLCSLEAAPRVDRDHERQYTGPQLKPKGQEQLGAQIIVSDTRVTRISMTGLLRALVSCYST